MMKKTILICLGLLACLGMAARTARDFFAAAPDDVFVLLPQSTRLDMLDYFEFGSTRASLNSFRGESRMTAVSDAVVAFDVDKGVDMQIAVIPVAKADTVLALVTTLRMPVADSDIKFYDTSWRQLPKAPFAMPGYDEWLSPGGKAVGAEVRAELPFMPVSAAFDAEAKVLRLANEAPSYVDATSADSVRSRIVMSRVYDIKAGKFELRK